MTVRLAVEIEEKIRAAERLVEEDISLMQESIDGIDAIPLESFDDDSLVNHVEDLRASTAVAERGTARARRDSSEAIKAIALRR